MQSWKWRTYKQSSDAEAKLISMDPSNTLLARAPRYRMPSWMIRDSILKSTGMLTERVGGPPVFPFQPAGAWADSTMGRFEYKVSPGKDAYRRSLYTFWRRSVGPTNMFDSSKRRNCSVRMVRTNTPLQALNLMNDSAYVEAAGHLAHGSISHEKDLKGRLYWMSIKVLSRPLSEEELKLLEEQYEDNKKYFTVNTEDAKDLISIGQFQIFSNVTKPAEAAALQCVAQTILNLDEAMTRE